MSYIGVHCAKCKILAGQGASVYSVCVRARAQVHELTLAHGAYPSPYNYFNFPKSVCTSINEVRSWWHSPSGERGR